MRSKFRNMQDLERMKEMMRQGVSKRNEFRSAGEEMAGSVAGMGEAAGKVVEARAAAKKKRRKKMNDDIGETSKNLTRRAKRGSGM